MSFVTEFHKKTQNLRESTVMDFVQRMQMDIPRIDQMILKLRQELLGNLYFYGKWLDEKDDILIQFDNYDCNHLYSNQDFVDFVLLLISNAYKIKIEV